MHRPSSTAVSARARTLVEHMHRVEHWVYAVPIDHEQRGRPTTLVTATRRDDLDVTLLEARGAAAATELAELLSGTEFFAQSALLDSAFDVSTEDARTALLTLAHMSVCWDGAWADLFNRHFGDADVDVRRNASAALLIAARTSGAYAECASLLRAVRARETAPEGRATIDDALATMAASEASVDALQPSVDTRG